MVALALPQALQVLPFIMPVVVVAEAMLALLELVELEVVARAGHPVLRR
jgi:hypothetical protein